MKLTTTQLRAVTCGAVSVKETADGLTFHRFTDEQEVLYSATKHAQKMTSTPGIRLEFRTDSRSLSLDTSVRAASSRSFFSFDIYVNGEMTGMLDNYSDMQIPANYAGLKCPGGRFAKTFDLGEGEKHVVIHFPFSVCVILHGLTLDDGASCEAVKYEKKLLAFGDSITHGYDALHTSLRYPARLARMLGMDEYNKGIGGEVFRPALAALREPFTPDLITVAYGTNDWNSRDEATFTENCRGFFETLSAAYPDTPIAAITPIWRGDHGKEVKFGDFHHAAEVMAEICAPLSNVTVIRGWELVPHAPEYFGDLRLHPSDEGFAHYAENLREALRRQMNI